MTLSETSAPVLSASLLYGHDSFSEFELDSFKIFMQDNHLGGHQFQRLAGAFKFCSLFDVKSLHSALTPARFRWCRRAARLSQSTLCFLPLLSSSLMAALFLRSIVRPAEMKGGRSVFDIYISNGSG